MTALRIPTAPVFVPLLQPARYKGAYGGRGSGKSHDRATALIEAHMLQPGLRSVCIREVQKSLKESAKRLIEDKIQAFGLGARDGWDVQADRIVAPGNGVILFQGMQDHTAESIKSLEGVGIAWVEEAQTLSERSLMLLRPTIRAEGSELWFTWNPRRAADPVEFLRRDPPPGAIVVRANWSDNPWFPQPLEDERRECLRTEPDQYGHIWEGEYATVLKGAYYAASLALAKAEGRIASVARDPLMSVYAVWDIGGTGAKADATAIWVCQMVGTELRFIDYYEAVGQPLSEHVEWLRAEGYQTAECILPHDGGTHDKVHQVTFESALRQAGFSVRVIPNMGQGASRKRIEAARRRFPSMRFDAEKCKGGLAALGWYHERYDEARQIGLGPEHDWSSHGADAFGLAAVAVEYHPAIKLPQRRRNPWAA